MGALGRSQNQFLPILPPLDRALIVGGGTGRFLADLMRTGRVKTAVSVDLSPGMNRQAARKIAGLGFTRRVEFRTGTVDALGADERFDLIVTHCFLDLFAPETLRTVVARLDQALKPNGYWIFSDFSTEGSGATGSLRRAAVDFLYRFFRLTCRIEATALPDFEAVLASHALIPSATGRHLGGLLRSTLYRKNLAS